jgi:hypothetical protein
MLYSGDEKQHNNPLKAYVDANFIRGGGRLTADLSTLLTDFTKYTDQLKENVTLVYVMSEGAAYRLKSIANIGSLANGWKAETIDFTKSIGIGPVSSLTGLHPFEFVSGGDEDSELVLGAASNGNRVRLFGFRASGDKGQNGAPAGKYPMRLENYYGYNWMLAGVNANNDDNVNHFGIYQADGTTELLYVDNLGKVRMIYPSTSGTSTDNVLVIGTDGLIKQISQTSLQAHYKGKYTTLAALQAVAGVDGDYAILDTGVGVDAIEYICDSNDNKWVKSVNVPASTFAQLGGLPIDNAALATVLGQLQPKEVGKGLYPDSDKVKLGKIYQAFTLSFIAPVREVKDYFETTVNIRSIILDGASSFQYSLNNGMSYTTVSLPLTADIEIPANRWVRWRIGFTSNSTIAAAYIKLA